MDRKFVFPVATMLGGLGLWIALVILRPAGFGPVHDLQWPAPALCILSGALILVSGIRCATAGGPLSGQLVRLAVLLGLAAYARWVSWRPGGGSRRPGRCSRHPRHGSGCDHLPRDMP